MLRLRNPIRKTGKRLHGARAAAAVASYVKAHPEVDCLSVQIEGRRIVVTSVEAKSAPDGFFHSWYTEQLAGEDNDLAVHSVLCDPADFLE